MVQEINDIAKTTKDIEKIKKLGFNSVKFWYDWATAEPKPNFWNFEVMELIFMAFDCYIICPKINDFTSWNL